MESSAIDGEAEAAEAQQMDIDNVENAASSSNTQRNRSNSVIDSSCFRKYYSAVLEAREIRSRSKSLSTTDYYISKEHYMDEICIRNTPEIFQSSETKESDTTDVNMNNSCIAGTFQSSEMKKSDTIDAKANNISLDKVSGSMSAYKEPIVFASTSKDADCYNMDHENRGKCIIFNHEKFDISFDKREGSSLDASRLQVTFEKLGFDVELHNDFTFTEIKDKINEVSKLDHTNNDCLCIITLTHGVQSDLICAKDVAYKSDTLWTPFAADKCITLAGKPKLFFIQACRGDKADNSVILSPRSFKTETDSAASYAIPAHADFLIAHSSVQGFFTWRNPLEGTWYIQCLCDVLDKHGTTMDLMSILTLTARKVATDYASINDENLALDNKKQVPSVTTMLIRTVYFPPKKHVHSKKREEQVARNFL